MQPISPSFPNFSHPIIYSLPDSYNNGLYSGTHNFAHHPGHYLERIVKCGKKLSKLPRDESSDTKRRSIAILMDWAELVEDVSQLANDSDTHSLCVAQKRKLLQAAKQQNEMIRRESPNDRKALFDAHNIEGMMGVAITQPLEVRQWIHTLIDSCDLTAPDNRVTSLFMRIQELTVAWRKDRNLYKGYYYSVSYHLLPLMMSFAHKLPKLPKRDIGGHVKEIQRAFKKYHNLSKKTDCSAQQRFLAQKYWLAVAERENQAIKHLEPTLYTFHRIVCLESNVLSWRPIYRRTLLKLLSLNQHLFGEFCQVRIEKYDTEQTSWLKGASKVPLLPMKRTRYQVKNTLEIDSAWQKNKVKTHLEEAMRSIKEKKGDAIRSALLRAEMALDQLQQMKGKYDLAVTQFNIQLLELNHSSGLPSYLRAVMRYARAKEVMTGDIAFYLLLYCARRAEMLCALDPKYRPQAVWDTLRELAEVINYDGEPTLRKSLHSYS